MASCPVRSSLLVPGLLRSPSFSRPQLGCPTGPCPAPATRRSPRPAISLAKGGRKLPFLSLLLGTLPTRSEVSTNRSRSGAAGSANEGGDRIKALVQASQDFRGLGGSQAAKAGEAPGGVCAGASRRRPRRGRSASKERQPDCYLPSPFSGHFQRA